ncbi:hypothetical protein [Agromyces albus]|uniref:Uncharacterized protein n=1 Tax=Agromyces albus TaxID=205332 RepID=A0A4Q2L3M1_9MICO|nr:hypothetical protein [Agromyces albus]RXZ72764.1 hypothetical protein ESP51_02905 [Agromyces albus]
MTEPDTDTTAEPSVDGAALTAVSPAVSAAGDSVVPLASDPVGPAGAQQATKIEPNAKKERRWLKNMGLWASGVASAVLAGVLIVTFQFFLEQSAEEVVEPPTAERLGCESGSPNQADGEQYLTIQLSQPDEDCWQTALEGVNPGDEFDVLVWWRNWTGRQVDDTTIRAYLDDGLEFVPGTATWHNTKYPDGLPVEGDLLETGINVGSYLNGANAYILFTARMSETFNMPCGFAVTTVAAQLPTLPAPQNEWTTAGLVTNARC